MKKGSIQSEGILDLHGYRLENAKIILKKFITESYNKNLRNILVITGKGLHNTGVLKKEVPLWLNEKGLVNLLIDYKTAPNNIGGEGALLVRLKNKSKRHKIDIN